MPFTTDQPKLNKICVFSNFSGSTRRMWSSTIRNGWRTRPRTWLTPQLRPSKLESFPAELWYRHPWGWEAHPWACHLQVKTFAHQPLASGPQPIKHKKGFHKQIQSCNRKHIMVGFFTEMTVSRYKLDHLAINSTTAMAGKAWFTLASGIYQNLWPSGWICIRARWQFLIVLSYCYLFWFPPCKVYWDCPSLVL